MFKRSISVPYRKEESWCLKEHQRLLSYESANIQLLLEKKVQAPSGDNFLYQRGYTSDVIAAALELALLRGGNVYAMDFAIGRSIMGVRGILQEKGYDSRFIDLAVIQLQNSNLDHHDEKETLHSTATQAALKFYQSGQHVSANDFILISHFDPDSVLSSYILFCRQHCVELSSRVLAFMETTANLSDYISADNYALEQLLFPPPLSSKDELSRYQSNILIHILFSWWLATMKPDELAGKFSRMQHMIDDVMNNHGLSYEKDQKGLKGWGKKLIDNQNFYRQIPNIVKKLRFDDQLSVSSSAPDPQLHHALLRAARKPLGFRVVTDKLAFLDDFITSEGASFVLMEPLKNKLTGRTPTSIAKDPVYLPDIGRKIKIVFDEINHELVFNDHGTEYRATAKFHYFINAVGHDTSVSRRFDMTRLTDILRKLENDKRQRFNLEPLSNADNWGFRAEVGGGPPKGAILSPTTLQKVISDFYHDIKKECQDSIRESFKTYSLIAQQALELVFNADNIDADLVFAIDAVKHIPFIHKLIISIASQLDNHDTLIQEAAIIYNARCLQDRGYQVLAMKLELTNDVCVDMIARNPQGKLEFIDCLNMPARTAPRLINGQTNANYNRFISIEDFLDQSGPQPENFEVLYHAIQQLNQSQKKDLNNPFNCDTLVIAQLKLILGESVFNDIICEFPENKMPQIRFIITESLRHCRDDKNRLLHDPESGEKEVLLQELVVKTKNYLRNKLAGFPWHIELLPYQNPNLAKSTDVHSRVLVKRKNLYRVNQSIKDFLQQQLSFSRAIKTPENRKKYEQLSQAMIASTKVRQTPNYHKEGPTIRHHLAFMIQWYRYLIKNTLPDYQELVDLLKINQNLVEQFILLHDIGKGDVETYKYADDAPIRKIKFFSNTEMSNEFGNASLLQLTHANVKKLKDICPSEYEKLIQNQQITLRNMTVNELSSLGVSIQNIAHEDYSANFILRYGIAEKDSLLYLAVKLHMRTMAFSEGVSLKAIKSLVKEIAKVNDVYTLSVEDIRQALSYVEIIGALSLLDTLGTQSPTNPGLKFWDNLNRSIKLFQNDIQQKKEEIKKQEQLATIKCPHEIKQIAEVILKEDVGKFESLWPNINKILHDPTKKEKLNQILEGMYKKAGFDEEQIQKLKTNLWQV